jgi:uncharacterized protein (TIGR02391 family)
MASQLTVSKEKFSADIKLRIDEGKAILSAYHRSVFSEEPDKLIRAYEQWNKKNYAWLGHVFSGERNSYMQGYENAGAWDTEKLSAARFLRPDSLEYKLKFFQKTVTPKVSYLEDLLATLEFIPSQIPSTQLQEQLGFNFSNLHPTVQQVGNPLVANGHYRQAVLDSCIALDKAVQKKAQLPASTVGTALMTKAFSANQPLIRLSQDNNEQVGFMNLYQGSVQAIRNHYAHNLTEIDPARALEWLSFISALFYKLDEAQPTAVSPTPQPLP